MTVPILSQDILELIPEASAVLSSQFQVITCNARCLELSGYTKKEMLSFNIDELFKSHESSFPFSQQVAGNKTGTLHIKANLTGKNQVIPVMISIKNQDNFIVIQFISLAEFVDIDKTHLDFISTVSHELRTPLTSIKGFADTLLRMGNSVSKDQAQRFISIIKDQAERLSRLVENILQVSRLESRQNTVKPRALSLKEPLTKVIQTIQIKDGSNHTIQLYLDDHLHEVWAEPDTLEQIMMNLIDNAVKYSPPKKDVTIKAYNNNKDIVIQVIDEGIGIPSDKIGSLFRKFSRLQTPMTQEVQGTGLGLYITKTLVESLKGKITVESTEGKGSTFTVLLPAAKFITKMLQEAHP